MAALNFQEAILDSSYFAYQRDVGDIDGDGDNDVVTIQEGDTNLQVFRAPTWARSTLINITGTYQYPRADDLKLADIDGDGDLDVVTRLGFGPTDDGAGVAVWYENLGGGSAFTQHLIGNSLVYVKDIVVADFDRDGRLDVAMRMDRQTQLWLQNSNGSWSEVLLSHPAHEGMEVGDLDMDGDPDLILNGFWFATPNTPAAARVAANYLQKTIDTAWWNQGGDWTADSCKVVVGDFDGDGTNDAAFSHSERSGYAVAWYGSSNPNGAGPWVKHAVAVVDYCHNLQAADWDLDGDVDLLVGGMIQSQHRGLKLMLNNGAGTSWSESVIQSDGSYSAEMGDIDQDGDLDVVGIRNWNSAPTWIYRNNSASGGDSTRPTIISVTASNANTVSVLFSEPVTTASAQTLANYDINNGVTISGAVLGTDTRTATLTTSTLGSGGVLSLDLWAYKQVTAAHTLTFSLCFPDVNGDGKLDVASGPFVYLNPGSTMEGTWTQVPLPAGTHAFGTLDVDGDNLADVISQQDNPGANRIDIYWDEASNVAGTSWAAPVLIGNVPRGSEPQGFQGYAVAQIVAGGRPEIIVNSPQGPYYFSVPASNPTAGSWPRILIAANNSEEGIGVADFDGDGNLDISFTHANPHEVKWARNPGNGSGNWSVFTIGTFPEADWPDRCAAADLNGDGRVDIIVTEENAGNAPDALACWWEQPVSGATSANWVRHTITTQYTMNSMDVGDIDNDGEMDIVLAEHRGTKRIAVWANNGQGNFTQHLVDSGKESHLGARLVDLDGDGDSDLVSIAYDAPNTLHLWRNDSPASAGGTYTLTVNNVVDRATPPNPILAGSQASFTFTAEGDTTRPTITSVTAVNATTAQVLFSEPVTTASAQTTGNYSLNNGVTASSAVLGTDTRTVTLTTSTLAGGSYTLTVNNVADRATPPNTIVANSQAGFSYTAAGDTTPPTIRSVTAMNGNSVQALFSEPVTTASAQTLANYSLNNGVTIAAAVLGADTRTVTLTTSTLAAGNYTLTVNNVTDRAAVPNPIAPNSQAAFNFNPSPPIPGLLAHWKFDEGAGTSAADASGNARTGTLLNGAGWATGQAGNAVNLDGINDYVAVPNLDITTSRITLAAWVNLASLPTGSDVRFISKATDATDAGHWWMLGHTFSGANHRLRFRLKTGGVTTTLIAGSGNLAANTWFHAAATYDGATMRLYLNGVEVGSTAKTGVMDVNAAVAVNLGRNPEGSNHLPGRLDKVRIYESSLSQAEVQQVMNNTAAIDTTRPTIISIMASNANMVCVLFSEPVTTVSAQTLANYEINNDVTTSGAVLEADTRTVTLTTSTLPDGNYMATLNNVADRATIPNWIATNTQVAFGFTAPPVLAPYQQWREAQFTPAELADPTVSCDTCDPDSDRLQNLMEYALGLDPKTADGPGRPRGRIENGTFLLTYTRRMASTDVLFFVEAAVAAQGPWSTNGLTEQLLGDDGEVQTFEAGAPIQTTDTAGFLRLRVEK